MNPINPVVLATYIGLAICAAATLFGVVELVRLVWRTA